MASTYATTIQKLKATKLRINRLSNQLATESDSYDLAFSQLQDDLSDELGQGVQILQDGQGKNLPMKHEIVLRRIKELRNRQMTFPDIAVRLNNESLKLPNVTKFTGDICKGLYDAA